MRNLFKWSLGLSFFFIVLATTHSNNAIAQDSYVSFQTFYDELSPYGQWIYDPEFGNLFLPYVEPDFRPYTRGRWVMTEYGNTWVSEDPWGWACYHYGRWTYNGYYGWLWIPGYEWAPAWVSWRYGNGYAGWAPLGPGNYAVGGNYICPETWWIFIEPHYLYDRHWHRHYDGYERNTIYISQTVYMNNYDDGGRYGRYNYGPRAEVVESYTHQPVTVYRTNNAEQAGSATIHKNTVTIYRPNVDRNTVNSARPTNVVNATQRIDPKGEQHNANNNSSPAFRQTHPKPNTTDTRNPTSNTRNSEADHSSHGINGQPHTNPPVQPAHNNPSETPIHSNPVIQPQQHTPQPQQPPHQNPAPQPQQPPRQNPAPQPQQPPRQNPAPQPQQPPRQNPAPQPQQPPRQNPAPQPQQRFNAPAQPTSRPGSQPPVRNNPAPRNVAPPKKDDKK